MEIVSDDKFFAHARTHAHIYYLDCTNFNQIVCGLISMYIFERKKISLDQGRKFSKVMQLFTF